MGEHETAPASDLTAQPAAAVRLAPPEGAPAAAPGLGLASAIGNRAMRQLLAREEAAPASWGWGGEATRNRYAECRPEGLDRAAFLAWYRSIEGVPASADDALGLTVYVGDPVPPTVEAEAVTDGGRTFFRLKPTRAEMPQVISRFTQAGRFQEGTRKWFDQERRDCPNGDVAIEWEITPEGAQAIAAGEAEHCADLRHAFDITCALYASVINNVAAANREYSTEQQARDDALNAVGVPESDWVQSFRDVAARSGARDDKGWHKPRVTMAKPSLDTNCRWRAKVHGTSLPEVDKHPPIEVMEDPKNASKRRRRAQR